MDGCYFTNTHGWADRGLTALPADHISPTRIRTGRGLQGTNQREKNTEKIAILESQATHTALKLSLKKQLRL